jgi:hypothetical protein
MNQGKLARCQSMAYLKTAFAQLTYPESLRNKHLDQLSPYEFERQRQTAL